MVQLNISLANKPNFLEACQSISQSQAKDLECSSNKSCKLIAASEAAVKLITSNPLAYMPNFAQNLKSISHNFAQNSLKMCVPKETIDVSFKWEKADAKRLAKKLTDATKYETETFIRFLNSSDISPIGIMTLSALASSTKGCIIAASLLKKLKNPNLGVSILFGMENPARAARVLNYWKHRDVEHESAITFELNRIKIDDKNEETRHRYLRLQTYEYGSTINAQLFVKPIDAVRISERVLLGFDRYEEKLRDSKENAWENIPELLNAQSKLKSYTLSLADTKVIKPCKISYDEYNRVEEMECPLVPPSHKRPTKNECDEVTSFETTNFIDDLKKMKELIDDYEYCEAMLDAIDKIIVGSRYQTIDTGRIHDIVDVIINLKDLIDEMEESENGLVEKGYDLPYSDGPSELRSILEDMEHDLIEIENAVIDMEKEIDFRIEE